MKQYTYCDAHGRVHVDEAGTDIWCTAARNGGMVLLYPAHMQEYAGWDDEQTLGFATRYVKDKGLWLYSPS